MDLRLTLFFVLMMSLRTCVNGSPVQRRSVETSINWDKCKNHAITLNQLAHKLASLMNVSSNMSATYKDDRKIESGDRCDPASIVQAVKGLELTKSGCFQTITGVLKQFEIHFGENGLFQTNGAVSDVAIAISSEIGHLLSALGEEGDKKARVDDWKQKFLQPRALERLHSFSILTARVFSFVSFVSGHTSGPVPGLESFKTCPLM